MKIVVDTNIILDVLEERPGFYEQSAKILALTDTSRTVVAVAASQTTDIHYLLKKHLPNATDVRSILRTTCDHLMIASVTGEDVQTALELDMDNYEDALLVAVANRIKVDWIVTRDGGLLESGTVPCISPAEFCEKYGVQ